MTARNHFRTCWAGGFALLLAACAHSGGGGAATRAAAEPNDSDSLVEKVAAALARGERAEAGPGGAARLAEAGRLLAVAGARPAEAGEPDLALHWADLAARRGTKADLVWRDRALGPAYRRGRVAPHASVSLDQLFLAGRKAEIALMPVGGRGRLVLDVTDDKGGLICRRRASDPPVKCAWLPVYTTRHAIRVRNEGAVPADYYLVMK
ncbi:MAG TPA: hypothetical protein VIT45_15550 [Allosphingosinicella sp.]